MSQETCMIQVAVLHGYDDILEILLVVCVLGVGTMTLVIIMSTVVILAMHSNATHEPVTIVPVPST